MSADIGTLLYLISMLKDSANGPWPESNVPIKLQILCPKEVFTQEVHQSTVDFLLEQQVIVRNYVGIDLKITKID